MKAYLANMVNGLALAGLGTWGALGATSPTAWIPVAFGVILLLCTPGVKSENKIIAHVAVLLTLLVLLSLVMPLMGSIGRADTMAIIRVCIMIITGLLAMVAFIGSFRAARKAREANN